MLYTCIISVKHVYYMSSIHVVQVHELSVIHKTPHVLDVYRTCDTHVVHLPVYC